MEKTILTLCDSDVLIEFLDRSNLKISQKLLQLGEKNLCVSAITAAEVLVGARDKKHFNKIKEFIDGTVLVPINVEISAMFVELIGKYSLSHGLQVQDALIAATAIHFDLPPFTLNRKDFHFIEGLKILA